VSEPLTRLAGELRAGGGLLAQAVVDPPVGEPTPHGDAVASRGPEYALLVEAIREGYLLHYGTGRVVRTADPDLALLAGDRLYALGLARLAELGDLEGVGILADVISRSAQAHAQDDPAEADRAWSDGTSRLAG
jgi:hypothetical protein